MLVESLVLRSMPKLTKSFSPFNSPLLTSRGFTLIEIILVMSLIGIMATVVISLINPVAQFQKSRDAQRKSDLRQIQSALELYRADQGSYPGTLTCGNPLKVASATYMRKIPCDPNNTGKLIYTYSGGGGMSYKLIACLENVNDSQRDISNDPLCAGGATNYWSYTLNNP